MKGKCDVFIGYKQRKKVIFVYLECNMIAMVDAISCKNVRKLHEKYIQREPNNKQITSETSRPYCFNGKITIA